MGKIVKLKNKKTGVKVYPVTATSAVVDANSGERLNDALKNKVEEAPMDGAQYVRKNGGWEVAEVSMDPNEICRINLKSNQGDADNSSLNGVTVNVVNTVTGDVIYNGTWNGSEIQLSIPGATTYKVTVGDVADYKTPDAITIEATAFSSRDLILTYQTEVVSVTLSSNNGVSVVGQTVTINGKTHTWNGSVISQKVAFGVEYSVLVDAKAGFIIPGGNKFTSSQLERSVALVYTAAVSGVYIEDTNRGLWTAEGWDGSATPSAFVLLTDTLRRRITLEVSNRLDSYMRFYDEGVNISNYLSPLNSQELASLDYSGEEKTRIILSAGASEGTITYIANSHIFADGKRGYLPSVGEVIMVNNNMEMINRCRNVIGLLRTGFNSATSTYAVSSEPIFENKNTFWGISGDADGREHILYHCADGPVSDTLCIMGKYD